MLNKYAFNAKHIGPGLEPAFTRGIGTQALRLIGVFTPHLIKYGQGNAAMTLDGHLRITQEIAMVLEGVLSLTGDAKASVHQLVYGTASRTLRVFGEAMTRIRRTFSAAQSMVLAYVAVPRRLTAIHVSGDILMRMPTMNLGSDYYTGPAPEDRTTGIVDLTTQTTDSVEIG